MYAKASLSFGPQPESALQTHAENLNRAQVGTVMMPRLNFGRSIHHQALGTHISLGMTRGPVWPTREYTSNASPCFRCITLHLFIQKMLATGDNVREALQDLVFCSSPASASLAPVHSLLKSPRPVNV